MRKGALSPTAVSFCGDVLSAVGAAETGVVVVVVVVDGVTGVAGAGKPARRTGGRAPESGQKKKKHTHTNK
jgi:hypothetical protein